LRVCPMGEYYRIFAGSGIMGKNAKALSTVFFK
jgi:hypothetical protein